MSIVSAQYSSPRLNMVIISVPGHFSWFGGVSRVMCAVIGVETGVDVLIVSEYGRGAS